MGSFTFATRRSALALAQSRAFVRALEAVVPDLHVDELQLKRLKKRKLMLRDQIARLESELIPDLNA